MNLEFAIILRYVFESKETGRIKYDCRMPHDVIRPTWGDIFPHYKHIGTDFYIQKKDVNKNRIFTNDLVKLDQSEKVYVVGWNPRMNCIDLGRLGKNMPLLPDHMKSIRIVGKAWDSKK